MNFQATRNRWTWLVAGLVLLFALGLAAGGCASRKEPGSGQPESKGKAMEGETGGKEHGEKKGEEGEHGSKSAEVPPDAPLVEVTMKGMRFIPDSFALEAGKPIRFRVKNEDSIPHDFMVEGEDGFDTGTLAGGAEAEIGWVPKEAGKYTAFCSQPGHREAGMVAEIEVR